MILTGKKHPKVKLQRFWKVRIWTFGWLLHQINSIYEVPKLKQNFRKRKVVTGKTPFFVIGQFCTPIPFILTLASDKAVLQGNVMLSIVVLLTKKWSSSFLKSVCIFQKIYFKVEVLKSLKISSDCDMKAYRSLKWRAILKIHILKEPMLFLLALKWKSVFCVKLKTNFWRKPCWNAERSNHSFLSNWWIAFFKHLYSLIMRQCI